MLSKLNCHKYVRGPKATLYYLNFFQSRVHTDENLDFRENKSTKIEFGIINESIETNNASNIMGQISKEHREIVSHSKIMRLRIKREFMKRRWKLSEAFPRKK